MYQVKRVSDLVPKFPVIHEFREHRQIEVMKVDLMKFCPVDKVVKWKELPVAAGSTNHRVVFYLDVCPRFNRLQELIEEYESRQESQA